MIAPRTALAALALVLAAGCTSAANPVALPEERPSFDGNHTMGSGNRSAGSGDATPASSPSDAASSFERGNHTMGSGN